MFKGNLSQQRGVSLLVMIAFLLILGIGAIFAFKIVPAFIEHKTISNTVKKIVKETPFSGNFETEVRKKFDDAGRLNYSKLEGKDLTIEEATVKYNYEYKVPIVANIYLGVSFSGSEKAN